MRPRLAHVAFWTTDIDALASFWADAFEAEVGPLYESARRPGFRSRFVRLGDGATIELMTAPWIVRGTPGADDEHEGPAHVAVSLGSPSAVDALSRRLHAGGRLVSPPRWTGDGFYEAVIVDPDGNILEITA